VGGTALKGRQRIARGKAKRRPGCVPTPYQALSGRQILSPFQGFLGVVGRFPGVPLRSTPGYMLVLLRSLVRWRESSLRKRILNRNRDRKSDNLKSGLDKGRRSYRTAGILACPF
jgi:hypothetical protein